MCKPLQFSNGCMSLMSMNVSDVDVDVDVFFDVDMFHVFSSADGKTTRSIKVQGAKAPDQS